jgi:glucose/mannose-6-phosphate isomerase
VAKVEQTKEHQFMNILDQPEGFARIDPRGMYDCIHGFADQVEEAVSIGHDANPGNIAKRKIRNIVVAGLGGSAIGGDLVRSYLAEWLPVPMLVVRDYVLPSFVNEHSLVLVSSYSGNTEETLSAYGQAMAVGAQIVAFTTGGALAERASADGHAVIELPGGLMPRAALGYSFFPMLMTLHTLGFGPDPESAIAETLELVRTQSALLGSDVPMANNPAKRIAAAWHKKVPIIYGGTVRFDAVALRIKCQIAENSKQLAFANVFPEFNHNELVGYGQVGHVAEAVAVCILRDEGDHRRTGFRMAIVRKMIADLGIPVEEIESTGKSPLARMYSLIQLGDYISYYMAILNEEDPTPIDAIDHLKKELSLR